MPPQIAQGQTGFHTNTNLAAVAGFAGRHLGFQARQGIGAQGPRRLGGSARLLLLHQLQAIKLYVLMVHQHKP